MIFKILVALTVLYFVLDAILARRGRRVFPFFKPKTVEHLIERRRQIEWILKCRDIPEEKRRIAQELVSSATAAIDDFRKKGHADLMATVAQVDGSFAKHLRPFKRNGFMEFIDSVWVVVLIALCIRFFLFESFRVPTGSMVPNIYIGDMLFVNNHFMMHARSEYKDAEGQENRRHLRRLWLETDDWIGRRPAAMGTLLTNARNHWEKNDVGVKMWDHM